MTKRTGQEAPNFTYITYLSAVIKYLSSFTFLFTFEESTAGMLAHLVVVRLCLQRQLLQHILACTAICIA